MLLFKNEWVVLSGKSTRQIEIVNSIPKNTTFSFLNFKGFIDNRNFNKLIKKLSSKIVKLGKNDKDIGNVKMCLFKAKTDINLQEFGYDNYKNYSKPIDTLNKGDIIYRYNLSCIKNNNQYTGLIRKLLRSGIISKIGRVKTGHVGKPPIAYKVHQLIYVNSLI